MPTTTTTPGGAIVAAVCLSVLALLVWAYQLALLNSLTGSDPAGNALGKAFAAMAMIALWVLLAVLAVVAFINGRMTTAAAVAALALIPVSGFASGAALELLARPGTSPFMWPIVIPAVVPPLVIAFCFWTLIPSFHDAVSAPVAGGFVWGATLLLCIAILPMQHLRRAADDQREAERAHLAADFASLPADAPLWEVTPYFGTTVNDEALARIRGLDRRQSDAEIMLERGDFPLPYLGQLDLDPTQTLCDKARAELRRRVGPLVLTSPNSKPYAEIADEMAGAASAMEWLVGHDCSCDAESIAWEQMAKGYAGSNWDFYRIVQVREPDRLGKALNEYPEKFSMLTPKAHLRAWLKFADDKELRDQALAGARQLDHRTSDAVEMLGEENGSWKIFEYLGELDLEPTPALCAAALGVLHNDFAKTWRPKSDDPRSYDELLGRLGGEGAPFRALIWLSEHGCDVEAQLTEAESLVRAYQGSPESVAMLATFVRLRRKL